MSANPFYRDEARVRHMCQAMAKVVEKSKGLVRQDLAEGEDRTELIIHYLTILGEAANNVSETFAAAHSEIDFVGMAGLRHKLVHDYANIDLDIIWDVITNDVPVQYPMVKNLADKLPSPEPPGNIKDFC